MVWGWPGMDQGTGIDWGGAPLRNGRFRVGARQGGRHGKGTGGLVWYGRQQASGRWPEDRWQASGGRGCA